MDDPNKLLADSAREIHRLSQLNELLSAKLEGVEMMAMAVASERHRGPGVPMQECMASKIDRYLQWEKEKKFVAENNDQPQQEPTP